MAPETETTVPRNGKAGPIGEADAALPDFASCGAGIKYLQLASCVIFRRDWQRSCKTDIPMTEHKASIKWARNGADFGYKSYSRDHVWRFDNGIEAPASAAPAYLGNPQRLDPESAFVAALSSCHMLTFLALASNKGFIVDRYEDNAVGHLDKNANGKLAITLVELHPDIVCSGAKQPTQADLDWLHDKAHRECFIANSVTTEIRIVPAK
jgi:organic hydroperoxide reductase OsmC/OhrA